MWFARLCQTHTSLLLSPSLSQFLIVLLLLFFTFCQTSFHGKMKQKNDACLKNKIKKNVKMPFRPHWGWATSYKCAKHSSTDTRGKQSWMPLRGRELSGKKFRGGGFTCPSIDGSELNQHFDIKRRKQHGHQYD